MFCNLLSKESRDWTPSGIKRSIYIQSKFWRYAGACLLVVPNLHHKTPRSLNLDIRKCKESQALPKNCVGSMLWDKPTWRVQQAHRCGRVFTNDFHSGFRAQHRHHFHIFHIFRSSSNGTSCYGAYKRSPWQNQPCQKRPKDVGPATNRIPPQTLSYLSSGLVHPCRLRHSRATASRECMGM